jgi:hypothetical protein
MKGDRPRRKHDSPLALGAHQPIEAGSGGPLDELLEFPIREQQKREQQAHQQRLGEVKRLIRKLRQCCRKENFHWPVPEDLKRLDDLVLKLAGKIRKRPALVRWKNYKAVDNHWHLKLWQIIEELVDRAARLTPPRPLERYNLLLSVEKLSDVTKAFFERYAEVVRGKDPSSIDWQQFEELFKRTREKSVSLNLPLAPRLGELVGGKPKLIAYTVFLELYCADQQWRKQHWLGALALMRWIAFDLHHSAILQKLSRFVVPAHFGRAILEAPTHFERQIVEMMKERHRAKDRKRKRPKKLAQN